MDSRRGGTGIVRGGKTMASESWPPMSVSLPGRLGEAGGECRRDRPTEVVDAGVVDDVGRHQVDGVADRAQQGFVVERGTVETAREVRIVAEYVEGGDHPALA